MATAHDCVIIFVKTYNWDISRNNGKKKYAQILFIIMREVRNNKASNGRQTDGYCFVHRQKLCQRVWGKWSHTSVRSHCVHRTATLSFSSLFHHPRIRLICMWDKLNKLCTFYLYSYTYSPERQYKFEKKHGFTFTRCANSIKVKNTELIPLIWNLQVNDLQFEQIYQTWHV